MTGKNGYYYLKLKENFFDGEELKLIESMENGYLYSNILLKMYLKALKNNGKLIFNDIIPYNTKMLATITGHNIDVIEKAIKIFIEMHLIEILDNGAIYMMNMQQLIGSISSEGIRKSEYREKIKLEKEQGTKLGQCPNIISNYIDISNSNSNYNSKSNSNINNYKEIIDYLNNKINSNYKYTTKKTQSLIDARLKEKFTIDNFKKVIDNMCFKWKGTEYEQYLRPETLFGTKFEGYLNLKIHSQLTETKETEDTELVTIMYIDKYGGTTIEDYPRKKGQTEWTEEDKERILKEKGGKKWLG